MSIEEENSNNELVENANTPETNGRNWIAITKAGLKEFLLSTITNGDANAESKIISTLGKLSGATLTYFGTKWALNPVPGAGAMQLRECAAALAMGGLVSFAVSMNESFKGRGQEKEREKHYDNLADSGDINA